ncbi:MAG: hypothetical protein HKN04_03720, partial [Rhodothermaceae bacterium]|nr:hypothetical protein [Rhodothermaceae bacterium]
LHLWRAYSYLIDGLRFSGRYAEALALIDDKALAHLHALERRYPTQPRVQYGLHVCYDYIGVMHQALGHVEQSVVPNETSLQYAEAMVLADSSNQKAHEAVARSYSSLGRLMGQLGRVEPSLEAYQKATTFYGQMYARNPQNHSIGNMLGNSQRLFCRVLLRAERLTEALKICLEGIRTYEELVSIVEESAVVRGNLAATYAYTAQSYRALALAAPRGPQRQRYRADALRWYDRALTILYERDENHSEYDREVYPDTLAAERDAFLLTVGE